MKANLLDYLSKDRIVLELNSSDRWHAIDEMLSVILPRSSRQFDRMSKALREAESKKCSAVGKSVTIIHAITEEVPGIRVAFGRNKKGIAWDAPDGRYVIFIWLLIHPRSEQERYLDLLAQTARICRSEENRARLMNMADEREFMVFIAGLLDHPPPEG